MGNTLCFNCFLSQPAGLASQPACNNPINPFPLLSLPQLAILAIVKCLDNKDKLSIAGTCRTLANVVSSSSKKRGVIVRPSTGWAGLRRVLTTDTITCQALTIYGGLTTWRYWRRNSATAMLLRSNTVPGCSLQGIEGLCINARPLPCLLPQNLAAVLPDMQALIIVGHSELFVRDADLQPLPYCSSLSSLSYVLGESLQLPSRCHTAEDFQRQLPNVSSLTLSSDTTANMGKHIGSINRMLLAWGGQLTKLSLTIPFQADESTAAAALDVLAIGLQHCTRLHSSKWGVYEPKLALSWLPTSLTNLTLTGGVSELDLVSIFMLPFLEVLEANTIGPSLRHDWSNSPCAWRKLKLIGLRMEDLSKLPLHSLKGKRCLRVKSLTLPNPLLADNLTKVQDAVQCVRAAGITIDEVREWIIHLWKFPPETSDHDEAAANILRAASSVVQTRKTYHTCPNVVSFYPCTTSAMFKWSCHGVYKIVILPLEESQPAAVQPLPQPWFWQALQGCSKLGIVGLCVRVSWGEASTVVLDACNYWVAVTHRTLTVKVAAACAREDMQAATANLRSKLNQELPATVQMTVDIDSTRRMWVVKLNPVQHEGSVPTDKTC